VLDEDGIVVDYEGLAYAVLRVIANLDVSYPWRRRAACRDAPGIDFFPGRGESTEPAMVICRSCPVRQQCAAFVASFGRCDGVWGATSGSIRRGRKTPPVRKPRPHCEGCGATLPLGRVGRCSDCAEDICAASVRG